MEPISLVEGLNKDLSQASSGLGNTPDDSGFAHSFPHSLSLSLWGTGLFSSAFLADSKLQHSFSSLISVAGGSDSPSNACQEVVRL